jgi:fumarate hydratase class II
MDRIERDTMGEMRVPEEALYGAQTAGAVENFPISGRRMPREFIRALGMIKAAAARVNARIGELPSEVAAAIERAAGEVAEGKHDAHFPVDVFQTGSGTSTNMNANEVIGRLAGAHPNDQVNRGQSSNDVFPTAIHVAAAMAVNGRLLPSMEKMRRSLEKKTEEFADVLKIGRTHLQDAVPMRLGQEFSGYARQVELAEGRVAAAAEGLYELPLGGTALGTG